MNDNDFATLIDLWSPVIFYQLDADNNTYFNQLLNELLMPNQTEEQMLNINNMMHIFLEKAIMCSWDTHYFSLENELQRVLTYPNSEGYTSLSMAIHADASVFRWIFDVLVYGVNNKLVSVEKYRDLLLYHSSVLGTLLNSCLLHGSIEHLSILFDQFKHAVDKKWLYPTDYAIFLIQADSLNPQKSITPTEIACISPDIKMTTLYFKQLNEAVDALLITPEEINTLFTRPNSKGLQLLDKLNSISRSEPAISFLDVAKEKNWIGESSYNAIFGRAKFHKFPTFPMGTNYVRHYFIELQDVIEHKIHSPLCIISLFKNHTKDGYRLLDQLIINNSADDFDCAIQFLHMAFQRRWIDSKNYIELFINHALLKHSLLHELVILDLFSRKSHSDHNEALAKLTIYTHAVLELHHNGLISYEEYLNLFEQRNKANYSVAYQSINNPNYELTLFMIDTMKNTLHSEHLFNLLTQYEGPKNKRPLFCTGEKPHANRVNEKIRELKNELLKTRRRSPQETLIPINPNTLFSHGSARTNDKPNAKNSPIRNYK